jgi:hypothetical protein
MGSASGEAKGVRVNQQRLFKREKPNLLKQAAKAESSNVVLARVILASPDRYAGLQLQWAERVLAKVKQKV